MSNEAPAEPEPQPEINRRRSAPKRQHVIPRLHLKNFVADNPKGLVWTYDAVEGTARPATPENTGVQSYFYSAETTDGKLTARSRKQ